MISAAFPCDCCGEPTDPDEAIKDPQIGAICPICNYRCIEAQKHLFSHGMKRPVCRDDVNESNYRRFQAPS